jgi:hypothetical protein
LVQYPAGAVGADEYDSLNPRLTIIGNRRHNDLRHDFVAAVVQSSARRLTTGTQKKGDGSSPSPLLITNQ